MTFKKIVSSPSEKNKELAKEIEAVVSSMFPITGESRTLSLKSINTKLDSGSYSSAKKAISNSTSVLSTVEATLELTDKKGKLLDRKKITLLRLPIITKKNSFIVDGTAYSVINQQRLKSGIYTYKRSDGVVYSTVRPDNGREFKVFLADNGELKVNVSSKTFKGMPILLGFGLAQKDIEAVVGPELMKSNLNTGNPDVFDAFKEFVFYNPEESLTVDEDVVLETTGVKTETVDRTLLIGALKKLVSVSSGKEEEDEPTNLIFKQVMTAPALISEQYKKSLKDVIYKLRFKLNKGSSNKIKDLVSGTNLFTKPLKTVVSMSKLSRIPDEYNPINALMYGHLITPMGEGGVGDTKALTLDHKGIHHSQLGFLDPIVSPEGASVGITLAVTDNAYVSENGDPAMSVLNAKTGKREIQTLKHLWGKKLAYPDTVKSREAGLFARFKNKDVPIKSTSQADYILPSPEEMHSPSSNFIPLLNSIDANRTNMAQKHIQQALPLEDPDIPHVGTKFKSGQTTGEDSANRSGSSLRSTEAGVVTKVDAEHIYIKGSSGTEKIEYATDLPFSTKTFLSHKVVVKKGDKIKKGQLIADSNFSKNGEMAIGKNLNVAWLAMPGNRNDGVIISESAAKKMTSVHLYKEKIEKNPEDITNLAQALLLFPSLKETVDIKKYNANGTVKKGVILQKGDPMAIVITPNNHRQVKSKLSKMVQRPYGLSVTQWKKKDPGEVVESTSSSSVTNIETKVKSAAKIGDKLSARAGNKGIISEILPDDEMPTLEDGTALDMTLTSAGVTTRINPGVLEEGAFGKVSEATGKNINLEHYSLKDNHKESKNAMLSTLGRTRQVLINPETKKPFPRKIFVGKPYIIKLFKDSEGGASAVGVGSVDQSEQATKGGKTSASAISNMEVNTLLAHGADEVLAEARDVKGQANSDFFNSFMAGTNHSLKTKDAFVMDKFSAILEQFNVSVNKDSDKFKYTTKMLSSNEVRKRSNGRVVNSKTVDLKSKIGESGGLFDDRIFGGINGKKSGYIDLSEKVLNPLHEDELADILGMTKTAYLHNMKNGNKSKMVSQIENTELEPLIRQTSELVEKADDLNKVNKKVKLLKFLKHTRKDGKTLADVSTISAVSVIAPAYRPVQMDKNGVSLDGINTLYQDIIDLSSDKSKSPDIEGDLYLSLGALYGTHTSPNKSVDPEVTKGFLEVLKGKNPKHSFAQKSLTRKKQFMSGRGVIKPARGDISLDEIELPESIALEMYRPHLERDMLSRGLDKNEIDKHILKKSQTILDSLDKIVKEYPAYYNRAPSLWKHNMTGATPVIVKGDVIGINQLTERGHNADFDGDQMGVYATMTKGAAKEVRDKLFPSKHLFTEDTNTANPDLLILPNQDSSLGLYKASLASKKKPVRVGSAAELLSKIQRGEIDYNDPILI